MRCPDLPPVSNGRIQVEFGDYSVMYVARLVCDKGFITWGQASISCQEGSWSSPPASCRPLSCGFPPRLEKARARLENGTTLWNDEAVYDCEPGYLMVVNESSARDFARVTCSIQGEWTSTASIKCVDASQLDGFLSGSAKVSINIIYSLLALLIIFSIPLLVFYCCSRRKQNQKKKGKEERSEKRVRESESGSPRAGIYSVSSGQILQPATVSPSTLRSLSSGSNSFKPSNPASQPSQPSSLPYNTWQTPDRRLTKTSLPFQFESPILTAPPSSRSTLVLEEPVIDEAGYASLIAKQDPLYEPLRETRRQGEGGREEEEEGNTTTHTYDDVPVREPEYANMMFYPGQASSYPDLLEMVRRGSKTPSPPLTKEGEEEEEGEGEGPHSHLYAKVDLSRKRSRPSSTESQETVLSSAAATASSSDSYTKTLIEKFNQFLEQSGHVSVSNNNYKNTPDKRLTSQH